MRTTITASAIVDNVKMENRSMTMLTVHWMSECTMRSATYVQARPMLIGSAWPAICAASAVA